MNFVTEVNMLRDEIRGLDMKCQGLQGHDIFEGIKNGPASYGREADQPVANENEMRANIQLAHRHLEDARMRLGKAIQAFEGEDIFDKPTVAAAIAESRQ